MKINVDKLDATIAKLQELRRLATDPALAQFVKVTGRSVSTDAETSSNGNGHGRGRLKASVLAACKQIGAPFTANELYVTMPDPPSNPKSIANVLRALEAENKISKVEEGSGRRATKYAA